MAKAKNDGFFLNNETYSAYFYITDKGYCYEEREDLLKPRRISQQEYESRLSEKYNW